MARWQDLKGERSVSGRLRERVAGQEQAVAATEREVIMLRGQLQMADQRQLDLRKQARACGDGGAAAPCADR